MEWFFSLKLSFTYLSLKRIGQAWRKYLIKSFREQSRVPEKSVCKSDQIKSEGITRPVPSIFRQHTSIRVRHNLLRNSRFSSAPKIQVGKVFSVRHACRWWKTFSRDLQKFREKLYFFFSRTECASPAVGMSTSNNCRSVYGGREKQSTAPRDVTASTGRAISQFARSLQGWGNNNKWTRFVEKDM